MGATATPGVTRGCGTREENGIYLESFDRRSAGDVVT